MKKTLPVLLLLSFASVACGGNKSEHTSDSDGMGGLGGGGMDFDPSDECMGECAQNESCCRGECVNLDEDVDNCGACEEACGTDNATASCEEAACLLECDEGFLDCDGDPANGCEGEDDGEITSAPAPIAPMLGAATGSLVAANQTGSLRPTFKWRRSRGGACGDTEYRFQATMECELDDYKNCAFDDLEINETTTDTEFRPEEDLPVSNTVPVGSRYYWRVQACDGLERCTDWSDVFYVDVGRDYQDITGDGYPDILIKNDTSHFSVILGGPEIFGSEETPASEITLNHSVAEESGGGFMNLWQDNPGRARFVGDVNGDGFFDWAATSRATLTQGPVPDPDAAYLDHEKYLYLGAATLNEMQKVMFQAYTWGRDIEHVFRAGDFNGDGYADVLGTKVTPFVDNTEPEPDTEPQAQLYLGRAEFFADDGGGPAQIEWLPGATFRPEEGVVTDYFGAAGTAGDFNGDGYPDIAIGAPGEESVHIYVGDGESVDTKSDETVTAGEAPSGGDTHYKECTNAHMDVGDFNGDGISDFLYTCPGFYSTELYFGDVTLPIFPVARWTTDSAELIVGGVFADLDDDGFDDVIFGSGAVYPGAETPSTDPELNFTVSDGPLGVARGDYDGDGFIDLVLAETYLFDAGRQTQVVRGDGTLDPLVAIPTEAAASVGPGVGR